MAIATMMPTTTTTMATSTAPRTKSADVVSFGVLLGMSVWFSDYGKGHRRR